MTELDERMKTLADRLSEQPSFVVLGRTRGDPESPFLGIIENSFSMSLSKQYVNVFWSGEARDNIVGALHELDGWKNAEHQREYFVRTHPDLEFTIYDLNAIDCPIDIDWKGYLIAHTPSDKTLSGVRDKFGARNPKFSLRTTV